jgi:predicted component of type VI protein secretion system
MNNATALRAAEGLQDDPLFEELQAAVRMSAAVLEKGGPDWLKVVLMAREILGYQSKHLLVAAYFAVGLIHTEGADGFLTGANFYLELIEKEWNTLYPPWTRAASRSKAIGWWVEKTASALKAHGALSIPADEGKKLRERLEKTNHFLQTHLEGTASLMRIAERVEALSSAQPSAEQAPAASLPAPATNGIHSEKEAKQMLQRISQDASRLAVYCASQDLGNPEINRLSRISTRIIRSIQQLSSYGAGNGDLK